MTRPIAQSIIDFIQAEPVEGYNIPFENNGKMTTIPISRVQNAGISFGQQGSNVRGLILFKGRFKPLPSNLLLSISSHARCRLFDFLENVIFKAHTSNAAIPPAVLETYSRILYMSPCL